VHGEPGRPVVARSEADHGCGDEVTLAVERADAKV